MMQVENISYSVSGNNLLDDVSAVMDSGKLTVILGPNGAGKSTLLKALSGEIKSNQGSVLIADIELNDWDQKYLATRRAVVSQFNQIEFPFTVAEVVMLGMWPAKNLQKVEQPELIAEDVMRELDVLSLMHRQYATLSGGEQQRVAIARALVQVAVQARSQNDCYLLLDEPTASLDMQYQHELLRILKCYASKKFTIVMVLHDLNLALQYADNVIFMKHGKVISAGPINKTLNEKVIGEIFSIKGVLEDTESGSKRFYVIN